ncbi:EamA family transporter [Sphaerisporangium fuscum]|uniref:EamA family transporter n=1 Tax=Sphaerisporangium fuscum TaxID=2835868 RepID=UPI001BDCBAE3|nr:EamA family transporter [Sphaerisporangium fuscum]
MTSIQIASAASTGLFASVGPAGSAWIRLTFAAVAFAIVARPRVWALPRADLGWSLVLGAVSGALTVLFVESIARIPLAMATALEFLGPLAVAVLRRAGRWGLVWPALALTGVLALTRPWQGDADLAGVALALGAAVCWGAYILLTRRVGERLPGVQGLAISMPAAAAATAAFGLPQALPGLSAQVLWQSAVLALLVPVLPYTLELLALRRLPSAVFGVLMCLEPALAVLAGLVLLRQVPAPVQLAGIVLVTIAGIGASRTAR